MEHFGEKKFSSPEEEIAFLRKEIARRELQKLEKGTNPNSIEEGTVGREVLEEYTEHEPTQILERDHIIDEHKLHAAYRGLETSTEKLAQILTIAAEKGIRNALSVLEKADNPYLTDEVHRHLIRMLREHKKVADLDEKMPLWSVLHMTLFEIALPRHKEESASESLKEIFAGMEQFYAGMQTIAQDKKPRQYSLEIAVSDKRDDIIFYVAVPNEYVNLFEKQVLSLFPHAVLIEQQNDYNIFVEGGTSEISVLEERKHHIYPLKTHETFEKDPLSVLLNAFSKIERNGGGAAVQLVISGGAAHYHAAYSGIISRIEKGEDTATAIRKSTASGEVIESLKDLFSSSAKKDGDRAPEKHGNAEEVSLFGRKIATPILATNIRLVASAKSKERAEQILRELESSFHQFQDTKSNQLEPKRLKSAKKLRALKSYSFREFSRGDALPLSITELATLVHFPSEGVESSPQFKQSKAKHAPAPLDLPEHGTLLGENEFRNIKKPIYITPEDRLRHMYVIGQTGTGKTTLLKNMIEQDIRGGAGVCMIDPHGTDIVDVLSSIPPERIDDVIYFDPSNTKISMGLNMLEYDPDFPEQKTFVVNELFSIFQKLYGANPESMGPMFEQYFRNATQLVLEHPASGNTLLDISRVLSDADYRNYKLKKAKNPVVKEFWTKIATKAGGEAQLENIVPYIVSKFDVFTANDYMRPIIGQQVSAFNFRTIMDQKKILLVNLSKGRLGEINAHLIGMIMVGKILMAALSRVDDKTRSLPPFYLYIDEFQNFTTNSIASILSEARKYKLSLTLAHQFIAQIEEHTRDAVFGNVGSMVSFRVGPEDATQLAHQFEPVFSAKDLMNIENFNAYMKLIVNGVPTEPFSVRTLKPSDPNPAYAEEVMEYSLERYGKKRTEVDREISSRYLEP